MSKMYSLTVYEITDTIINNDYKYSSFPPSKIKLETPKILLKIKSLHLLKKAEKPPTIKKNLKKSMLDGSLRECPYSNLNNTK